jgi:hypothetical protein
MEADRIPGEIQVTAHLRELLNETFLFTDRGEVDTKGKERCRPTPVVSSCLILDLG